MSAAAAPVPLVLGFWLGHVAPLIATHGLSNMAADKTAAVAGG